MENIEYIEDLFEFLEASPVNFLAVETARRKLEAAGLPDYITTKKASKLSTCATNGR